MGIGVNWNPNDGCIQKPVAHAPYTPHPQPFSPRSGEKGAEIPLGVPKLSAVRGYVHASRDRLLDASQDDNPPVVARRLGRLWNRSVVAGGKDTACRVPTGPRCESSPQCRIRGQASRGNQTLMGPGSRLAQA
jgi:hypothetical protein